MDKVYTVLGASNHTDKEREENDFYATDPKAMTLLLDEMQFNQNVWECASGMNHLADVLTNRGYTVRKTDIIDRTGDIEILDFLSDDNAALWEGDIITNPPYKCADKFVEKAMQVLPEGAKCAMFLKLQFLEGKKRRKLFEQYPPKYVYVSSSRIVCAKNGDF